MDLRAHLRGRGPTSARLLRSYLATPYEFHLRTNSTQLLRTLTLSVDQTYSRVVVSLITIAVELVVALATVILLAISEPLAALALLSTSPLATAVIARVVSARSRRVGLRFQQHNAEVLKQAGEALGAIKHVQLGGHEDHFVERLEQVRQQSADTKRKIQFLAEVPRQYFELAFVVGIGLMIMAVSVLQGSTRWSPRSGCSPLPGSACCPGWCASPTATSRCRAALPALKLVLDALDAPGDPAGPRRCRPGHGVPPAWRCATCRSGTRRADADALADVDLELSPGDTVALVGPSRRGEEHARRRDHGAAPADVGRAAASTTGRWPTCAAPGKRCIGLVPQDIYLLDATIAENLAFGGRPRRSTSGASTRRSRWPSSGISSPSCRPDCRRWSASAACGCRAANASGSGIARALYDRPRLLVLDEATSALDSITEAKITSTLRALRGQLTILTIAHRLSTVREADRLVLMAGRRIADEGPFDLLRARNASFRQLVDLAQLD